MKKEWYNPIQHNSFALPFLNCILMSWLATRWTGASFSGDLAKVLFWMGTVPLSSLTIFTIARCVCVIRCVCNGYFGLVPLHTCSFEGLLPHRCTNKRACPNRSVTHACRYKRMTEGFVNLLEFCVRTARSKWVQQQPHPPSARLLFCCSCER